MSSNYNLDEDVVESFEFIIGGHKYAMKYPTTEELMAVQETINKAEGTAKNTETFSWIEGFINPVSEGAPEFKQVLNKVNIKVLSKFSEMVRTELGLG